MKRHWWSLALSWPNNDQRIFSTAHDIFFKITKIHRSVITSFIKKLIHILVLPSACMFLFNNVLDLSFVFMIGSQLYLSITEHIICSHSYCFLFTGQTSSFCIERRWSRFTLLRHSLVRQLCEISVHWICQTPLTVFFICTVLTFYIRF